MNIVGSLWLLVAAVSCTTVPSSPTAREATSKTYDASIGTNGVVTIAVNWGRRWGCGSYENAQIVSLGFDRISTTGLPKDGESEVRLNAPGGRLFVHPIFLDYAILLEPGEYALTSFDLKVARSVNDVGHFIAKRSDLIENGKPKAGSFEVKAGEVVYIGNFWLDCQDQPMLWRYYTEGREGFKKHMAEVNRKYPFIDPQKITFRLFRTELMGSDYDLPR